VLSGCETGLGPRRAGQGLSSLQSALHAACAACTSSARKSLLICVRSPAGRPAW
jgi:hypothetical protein